VDRGGPGIHERSPGRILARTPFEPIGGRLRARRPSSTDIDPLGVVRPRTREYLSAWSVYATENLHPAPPSNPRRRRDSLAVETLGPRPLSSISAATCRRIVESRPVRLSFVQPGVVLDVLTQAAPLGRRIVRPDPTSSESRPIAGVGIVALRACGHRSLRYGTTADTSSDSRSSSPTGRVAEVGSSPVPCPPERRAILKDLASASSACSNRRQGSTSPRPSPCRIETEPVLPLPWGDASSPIGSTCQAPWSARQAPWRLVTRSSSDCADPLFPAVVVLLPFGRLCDAADAGVVAA